MDGPETNTVYDGRGGELPPHKQRFYAAVRRSRVLDIGCGTGQAARFLKRYDNVLDGITYSATEAELASPYYRNIYTVNLNDLDALQFIQGEYETILLGDILEHLIQPKSLLVALTAKLTANGRFYISVPNIANIVPRSRLLMGRFDYTETGIMDATHLRFFTRQSILRLVQDAGLEIVRTEYSHWNWSLIPRRIEGRLGLGWLNDAAKQMLTQMVPGLFATQIMLVATRPLKAVVV